ncbi:MAG: NAD-dependent epimerase/dehydratase family protein [Acidobacteriaceae bacterium]|nr:NAD-dependent epimerase/dehydratase family protein [Acidobacteriaceae bacterium]
MRRLLQMGHEVWIIDDLSTGLHPGSWLEQAQPHQNNGVASYSSAEGRVKFIHENLASTMLKQLGTIDTGERIELPAFDYVFALASIVGGRLKIDGDPLGVGVDLAIDALFFQWLARNKEKIGRVLYASSSAAYPINLQSRDGHIALREDMINFTSGNLGQPDMTYGWSKLTGEYLSHLAATHYGISVACVRPFSGYGEDQDLTYPVPAIAFRVARGDDPVTVWGTGEQGRDFVHIEDCITAMILAIERIRDGSGINIGTGRLTSFLEVARLFIKLDGREAEVKPEAGKPVGVQCRYCDPSEMERVLQWKPSISLEEGFARVLKAAHGRVATLGNLAVV